MKLTASQLEAYERDGFLVLPELFSGEEVEHMKSELRRIQKIDTDHLVREKTGGIAKTIYKVHEAESPTASAVFHSAVRSPRLLDPAQQLIDDPELYVYHTKCNLKTAIDGSVWQWHQDFGTWHIDGVKEPQMTTALVMLDEPTEMGGCLYFIPGSHKLGSLDPTFDEATGYRFYVVPKPTMLDILSSHPKAVPIIGRPGTVVFFDANIVHSSGHNLSGDDRWQAYVVYNQVKNKPEPVEQPRPDYVRSTNFVPLELGSDEILDRVQIG
ncbi:TPA: phytanoyl-CoA dioxygenase family protein [Burkholderia contaminans]|jgi:ectoine hydroxylase|uniref:phytanoyl-CoA dioxygenase family protein n=1 Tax=Burkholderia TaxID=32008 RepID=UPI00075DE1B8|nr:MULTISPECIES: phytanoyl-CoA dioxygenase family protein [Burkholderia]KVS25316.1 phytanoyl-CoA dioxygenase [Burkholderia vietnamiensis]MBM6431388.1 phytanoyl-CoA dioxygenase family protein [Burkholderia contaminans]MCB4349003.1 phytanoyl-CoA dioxygenase family protein [Burkholderia vietnamiensis]MDN8026906.1 phytanoyl-CoA dioxygenase family protein [Burkholderia contaminans]PRG03739.1 phytanoyl-CoA dioxygenase [Burkholderia contaminans]